MAVTTTKSHDLARYVPENTLQSLNLKVDNNLNEYVVLIVGIDDHHLFKNLSYIISADCIQSFNDIAESLRFIHSLNNTNIFLITSGTVGKDCANEFIVEEQVVGVYIYCMDESNHALWTNGMQKIRCTVSDATQLFTQLHRDIKQLSGRWSFGEKSFERAVTSTSQWYHLFLLVICYRPQYTQESYNEMFDESRTYHGNSPFIIGKITEFQQTYRLENAILEYTRDSFLYRIVNHALRTRNMEIIRKFSPYIRDLHSQLHDYHKKYYLSKEQPIRAVYRGQYLSLDELNYLTSVWKSRNPLITMTTFGSTSLDPDVALRFASPMSDRISCLFEIIITDEYNIQHKGMLKHEQAFANITSLSVMKAEQEVLFSLVTHFRVKHVEYYENLSEGSQAFIILELIKDKHGECSRSHFSIIKRTEKETNPQIYADIIHMLQVSAEDELKFKKINWQKWWNKLKYQWGTGLAQDHPLHLIFYDCFTDNEYFSRKAIEMHKGILRSIPAIESNRSSFSYLFKRYKAWQKTPTTWIALYEEYLEQLCTTNTKEVIDCLYFAGETYKMIEDKTLALECFQKAFDLNVDDNYQMNNKIQKEIEKLKKPDKASRPMDNELTAMVHEIPACKLPIRSRLNQLLQYIDFREEWYDVSDARIILRLPQDDNPDLSVNYYRAYFSSAVARHISRRSTITDATKNSFLTRWRYERYMREWNLFQEIKQFLQPFQKKSRDIRCRILRRLERFLKKLRLLAALCAIYINTQQSHNEMTVNNVQFINHTNAKPKQLLFFDLGDGDLLADLEALEEESSTMEEISTPIPDRKRMISSEDSTAKFIGSLSS